MTPAPNSDPPNSEPGPVTQNIPSCRLIASGLFILRMLFYLAIVLYAPALALSTITPLPRWLCILSAGVLSAGYTVSGGMRAVIWTDFFQFFVLWGGCALLVFYAGLYTEGGLGASVEYAFEKKGGLSLGMNLGSDRNVWTPSIGGLGLILIQLATDQVSVRVSVKG